MFKIWYLYNNLYMGWFKLVLMVKKVNMFKKKCLVCIFFIYNGSKLKYFFFDIYSIIVELMVVLLFLDLFYFLFVFFFRYYCVLSW